MYRFSFRASLFLLLLHFAPLRPALLRTITQLWWRPIMCLLHHHFSHLKIFLTIPVEILPLLHFLLHLLPRLPSLFFRSCLSLSTTQHLCFVIFDGDVYVFSTAQVVSGVFSETPGDESTGCVSASEDVVAATGAIGFSTGRDIEDGAVDDEVDGKGRVCAVVGGEFGGCEVYGSLLLRTKVSLFNTSQP